MHPSTRRHRGAVATAATALAAGAAILCGTAAPAVAEASTSPNSVGIVIETAPGKYTTHCVAWRAGLTGTDVIQSAAKVTWGTGKLAGFVIKLDGVGNSAPTNTQYWSYYHDAGTGWAYANTGPSGYKPKAGTVDGWVWVDGKDYKPPAVSYTTVCKPVADSPTTSAVANSANNSSDSSDSNAGLIAGVVIGVVAIAALGGGAIWLRHRRTSSDGSA